MLFYSTTITIILILLLLREEEMLRANESKQNIRVKRADCYKYKIETERCKHPSCADCPLTSATIYPPGWAECCYYDG
uniref:Uncharacterized protein n=1 Tax=Meloidogyne enterolobii TaxID=390850 RepID=A0A6V7TUG0_MELEN|nr:unnamed protein product [Meloidogyne enterolobii]